MKTYNEINWSQYPSVDSIEGGANALTNGDFNIIRNVCGDLVAFNEDRFIYLPIYKNVCVNANMAGVLYVMSGEDSFYVDEAKDGSEFAFIRQDDTVEITLCLLDESGEEFDFSNPQLILTESTQKLIMDTLGVTASSVNSTIA